MQVILLQDVKKLGRKDDVVKVKDGHALNFLIPNKQAIPATTGSMKQSEGRRAERVTKVHEMTKAAHDVAATLKGAKLSFKRKAEKGKLFGSVTEKDLIDGLTKEFKVELAKEMVEMKEHLKTLGSHTVTVRLSPEVVASVTVVIEEE